MDRTAPNPNLLSTVELGSKIASTGAVFVFLAYAIGYLKAAIIYYWLDAYWVMDFHSVQDFIVRGFSTVVIPALVAGGCLILGFDGDSHWRLIRYAGLMMLALCGGGTVLTMTGYLEVSPQLFAFAERSFYNLLAGGLLAAMIRTFQEGAIVRLRMFSFFSALVYICLLSDGVFGQGLVGQIRVPKPGTPLLSTGDDGKTYVLVSGINGKYLVAECGTAKDVKIVEPSEKVRVFNSTVYGCPVKLERSTLRASSLYRRLTSMPPALIIPYKAK
jgi:hypothetical protein